MCLEDSLPKQMDRRDFLKLGGAGLAGAVLLGTANGGVHAQSNNSLKAEIQSAADEYGVPEDLLLAMGHVNTLWEMPPPGLTDYDPGDLHGRGAYGIMQLVQNGSRDTLSRAAELTGLSEESLKNDRSANIRGGAALLAELQGKNRPPDLDAWQEAVNDYAGSALYVREVFERLEEGASLETSTGERIKLAPREVDVPAVYSTEGRRTDYPRAVWRPAYRGNYTRANRERSDNITRIIIHVVQGSYSSAVNWFQDPRAGVSAHYVVNRYGDIAQCVRHEDIAWHAGNWSYNCHSIGIEHAGYGSNRHTWTKKMYHTSARLSAYICRKHRIPAKRGRIIGHRAVPGGTNSCPGPHYNPRRYLRLVRYYIRRQKAAKRRRRRRR